MTANEANGVPQRLATWRGSRAVRLNTELYAADVPVHLTICAAAGRPFTDTALAQEVCAALEHTAANLGQTLAGYCLMPDHLHVVLIPGESGASVEEFLRRFKSYTTRVFQKRIGVACLWQRSARDRLVRPSEGLATVVSYVANNPVRAGLVRVWSDWPYARVFCEV